MHPEEHKTQIPLLKYEPLLQDKQFEADPEPLFIKINQKYFLKIKIKFKIK